MSPKILSWDDALHAIDAAALARGGRCVIGITGPVAAGKTTLARLVSACVVSTDSYLPDYDSTPEHLRDLPESSDLARLARDLAMLRAGQPTSIPHWSFQSHAREGETLIESAPRIVCEGLHALHASLQPQIDLRVFVDAPRAARWARCEAREKSGARGWTLEYLHHFFHEVAEPTFARAAEEYRASAHFVVVTD